MNRLVVNVLSLWFIFCAGIAADEGHLIRPGARPPLHVYDPSSLVPEAEAVIGKTLEQIRKTEFIDIVIVILPDLGGAPPDALARTFAGSWCDVAANCIVLHVPGHLESPWIFPGGRVAQGTPPEISLPAINAARSRAARENGGGGIVRAAASEAADLMRIWVGSAAHMEEITVTRQVRAQLAMGLALRRREILLIAGIGSCLPVLLGLSAFLISSRRKRARRFPHIHWHRRLGAPHAGGNHISLILPPAPPPES